MYNLTVIATEKKEYEGDEKFETVRFRKPAYQEGAPRQVTTRQTAKEHLRQQQLPPKWSSFRVPSHAKVP